MKTFIGILSAILQLIVVGARYAASKDASRAGQQQILLSLFKRISENINAAIKAGHDFDAELHADPDSLLADDGYKRRTTNIRDPTAGRPIAGIVDKSRDPPKPKR